MIAERASVSNFVDARTTSGRAFLWSYSLKSN